MDLNERMNIIIKKDIRKKDRVGGKEKKGEDWIGNSGY